MVCGRLSDCRSTLCSDLGVASCGIVATNVLYIICMDMLMSAAEAELGFDTATLGLVFTPGRLSC